MKVEVAAPLLSGPAVGPRPLSAVRGQSVDGLLAAAIAVASFVVYLATLAPSVLRSDSGEFHAVPWVLGIGHAPGYVLLTLLGRLAMFLPFGDPAYRVNLLDAAAAAAACGFVYLAVVELTGRVNAGVRAGGLAGAAALGLGATYWQQSVVGGPRPLSFLFTTLLLWLLFRWGNRAADQDSGPARRRALIVLAAVAGLSLTHHPNHLMLFPALGLYLLGRDPRLILRLRELLPALLAFLLPLALYAYLPLRSAMNPLLGPLDLMDPRELLLFVSATHYQDTVLTNCGGSRLIQAQRYLVFLTLQFGPLLPLGSALGALLTLVRAPLAGLALLYAFASNAVFGICSSLAMPEYIIPSYVVAGIWLGLAGAWPFSWRRGERESGRVGEASTLSSAVPAKDVESTPRSAQTRQGGGARLPLSISLSLALLISGLVLGTSAYRVVTGLPYQAMGGRTADLERGRAGMTQIQARGLLLSDWESITPLWYAQHVLGYNRTTKTALVTAAPGSDTWVIEAQKGLENRPVSLGQRVPAFGDNYRLFPVGPLHEVLEKPTIERATNVGLLSDDRALRLLGYRLDRTSAAPGELVRLTLYQKSDRGRDEPYWPVVRLGSEPLVEIRLDPTQRYPLPTWADNEVVGEIYELSLPAWVGAGELPIDFAYRVEGRDGLVGLVGLGEPWTRIGSIQVTPPSGAILPPPPDTIANFGNQLVLRGGKVGRGSGGGAPFASAAELRLTRGGPLDIEVHWSALRWMDESYTLFAHVLGADGRLVAQRDALPLGGIYHTHKWVPGQVITDWHQLPLPADLPAGEYWLELGAYHSVTTLRLPLLDALGGAEQTSFRWGPIQVE